MQRVVLAERGLIAVPTCIEPAEIEIPEVPEIVEAPERPAGERQLGNQLAQRLI